MISNKSSKNLKRAIVLSIALFNSCIDNKQVLTDINLFESEPIGTAYNVRMVYTDSMRISAILTATKHIDYTNLAFKYSEFPDGVKVVFYDQYENENVVTADYAILYDLTKIIDLQGNVLIKSNNGSELTSDQIFWDSSNDWVFTEAPFEFKDLDYQISATRLDTNKEFSKFKTGKLTGTVAVKDSVD
jgi:LPS export ABC transporter protein LptC